MNLKNKICIITGATSGIGREAAKTLASHGAILVIPFRNDKKAELLRSEIIESTPHANLDFIKCDFSSLNSVREFARIFRSKYDKLHLLINNAGIWDTKRKLSEDGIERMFALNHLAPFLLTNLLLDVLRASAPARIVNVASEAHRQGKIYFDDLEFSNKFNSLRAYAQSKLANILFTKKLSQKLKGSGVTANCLHPGFVSTNLFDSMPKLLVSLLKPFMISPEKGAQTIIYLATSEEVENTSGGYFAKSKPKKPAQDALRQNIADRLWETSEAYTGIHAGESVTA